MMQMFQKLRVVFGLLTTSALVCAPVLASVRMPAPSEKIVFNKDGKVAIPINDADYITYLGCGVLELSYCDGTPSFLYDIHGSKISFKVPEGTAFGGLVKKPNVPAASTSAGEAFLIRFKKDDRQGLCDFSGKIILPAKFRSVCPLDTGEFVAMGDNYQDELLLRPDGTIRATLKHSFGPEDVRPCLMGGSVFLEGRRSVDHGFGSLCALQDTSGKLVTDFKFSRIDSFHDGLAVAVLPTETGFLTVFIDLVGNVVRRFPEGTVVQARTNPNRYMYSVGNPGQAMEGLIDKDGKEIIPAKYNRLYFISPANYLAYRQASCDDIDIFNSDGKLLLHCDHVVKESSPKHTGSETDKSLNLSTLEKFLAVRDGALVASLNDRAGAQGWGLVNSEGEWIVPPIYSVGQIQGVDFYEVPERLFAFGIKSEKFSKEAWSRASNYKHLGRWQLFKLFLKEHDLIGMPVERLMSFWGEPLSSSNQEIVYAISKSYEGNTTELCLRLNDRNEIAAWRYVSSSKMPGSPPRYESPWERRNMTPNENKEGTFEELVPKRPVMKGK